MEFVIVYLAKIEDWKKAQVLCNIEKLYLTFGNLKF